MDYTLYIILHPALGFREDGNVPPVSIIFPMRQNLPRLLAALLFLTVGLLPQSHTFAASEKSSTQITAQDLVDEVNSLRAEKGLTPYKTNVILMNIAQAHAEYLAGQGSLTHVDANGKRPYQRALEAGYAVAGDVNAGGLFGEAIHSTGSGSVSDVVTFWKGNSADLAVMLSEQFQDFGIGVSSKDGITYYVLDVGAAELAAVQVTITTATGAADDTVALNTPLPSGEVFHTVKKNEALWSIALAYGTTIEKLKQLNRLATDGIFEGQVLLVVDAATLTPSPTTVPVTATLGIPTSTATVSAPPTIAPSQTPTPQPPTSIKSGVTVFGTIVFITLVAAAVGSLFGRKRPATKSLD